MTKKELPFFRNWTREIKKTPTPQTLLVPKTQSPPPPHLLIRSNFTSPLQGTRRKDSVCGECMLPC
ncbi:uncharacterized protein CCOS01_02395 [Colletotrichum costaricense]|uniref:Uncharacterized protein n=1 Tax=Colletotrichum costaricense TaxID=1209916 RepID=A0AAI9Z7W1_9PEZI|nr:uncharacterized protein CCOS01_02395 [Colletotrichum costaricense]KAK1537075.1 hypothetical protein CCOS01_02395 [Colletotrichum costaricense]